MAVIFSLEYLGINSSSCQNRRNFRPIKPQFSTGSVLNILKKPFNVM